MPNVEKLCTNEAIENTELKELESLIKSFINIKSIGILYRSLINPIENGGIGLINPETKRTAFLAMEFVKLLRGDKNNMLSTSANHWYGLLGLNITDIARTTTTTIEESPSLKIIPKYYRSILFAFNTVKQTLTKRKQNGISGDQLIWGNKYFILNSNMLFFKEWIRSGILYIRDIYILEDEYRNHL